jgi:hypothetical protein
LLRPRGCLPFLRRLDCWLGLMRLVSGLMRPGAVSPSDMVHHRHVLFNWPGGGTDDMLGAGTWCWHRGHTLSQPGVGTGVMNGEAAIVPGFTDGCVSAVGACRNWGVALGCGCGSSIAPFGGPMATRCC